MADTIPDIRMIEAKLDLNCTQMGVDGSNTSPLDNVKQYVKKLGLHKLSVQCSDSLNNPTEKPAELYINYASDPIFADLEKLSLAVMEATRKVEITTKRDSRLKEIKDEFAIFARRQHSVSEITVPSTAARDEGVWASALAELKKIMGWSAPLPNSSRKEPSLVDVIVANNPSLRNAQTADVYMPFVIRDMRERVPGSAVATKR